MAADTHGLRAVLARTLPVLAVAALLLSSLYFAGNATGNPDAPGRGYVWALVLSGIALVITVVAIGNRLMRMVQRLRARAPGARLTKRLVLLFVVLAVPPASIVYLFSLQFLNRGIDSWFDVQVEQGLADALDIAQGELRRLELSALRRTRRTAEAIEDSADGTARIGALLDDSDALELTLWSDSRAMIATATADATKILPVYPEPLDLARAVQRGTQSSVEPTEDGDQRIRVLVRLDVPGPRGETQILQAVYGTPASLQPRVENIQLQYERYQQLGFLRTQLKRSYSLILSLVMLLSVLLAVLLAFNTARRLVRPIARLSHATRAVAAGDYRQQVPVTSDDELGFLVRSFNQMTDRLTDARSEAERGRTEIERQRQYLEAVLGRLSSGVLSFDERGRLRTSNEAVRNVLGIDLTPMHEMDLQSITDSHPRLSPLLQLVGQQLEGDAGEWRREVVLDDPTGRQVLMCRGASIPAGPGFEGGQVLVFDDVTVLNVAQREAAWREVARRMAHEVKNPLTPIQLAAERLRHKYLDRLEPADADLLDRSTRTIVAQVEALKRIVNDFTDYAREPQIQRVAVDLPELIGEVADLYRADHPALRLDTDFDPDGARVTADLDRLTQLFNNLVKNAVEAGDGKPVHLNIVTRRLADDRVVIELTDDGPGFPEEIFDRLFEPYATTKPKGTGLGLSIVRKIVEEHGGTIVAGNTDSGARFSITLPAAL